MLKTFSKGGVHPPENKISANKAIEYFAVPQEVTIPVSMHIGAPATIVVKKGQQVKVGEIIAKSSGFVSANIHSSVSGTVQKIDDIVDASGYKRKSIVIKTEGDEWLPEIDRSKDLKKEIPYTSQEIVQKVAAAGVVGLGGATFPTHVKMVVPNGMKAELLIINGVECEPYLTSDHRAMLEFADEIMVGTTIIMKALGVSRAIIGVENNKLDAIEHLTKIAKQYNGIEINALKVKYPQGGEKQLIKAITGKEVPSGGLPIAVGVVVNNVDTTIAVYEAVQKNKPLIERVLTVTGKSIKTPSNFIVRIGTPISALIEAVGGLPEDTGKIINGGPMMGRALPNLDASVTKGSSCILVIPQNEAKRKPIQTCIRCAKCVSACPMGLEPYLLMILGEKLLFERAETEKIMDCIECGSCSYTCPSDRPLLDYIRYAKTEVGKMIRSRKSA